jgi:hypothetical protein
MIPQPKKNLMMMMMMMMMMMILIGTVLPNHCDIYKETSMYNGTDETTKFMYIKNLTNFIMVKLLYYKRSPNN